MASVCSCSPSSKVLRQCLLWYWGTHFSYIIIRGVRIFKISKASRIVFPILFDLQCSFTAWSIGSFLISQNLWILQQESTLGILLWVGFLAQHQSCAKKPNTSHPCSKSVYAVSALAAVERRLLKIYEQKRGFATLILLSMMDWKLLLAMLAVRFWSHQPLGCSMPIGSRQKEPVSEPTFCPVNLCSIALLSRVKFICLYHFPITHQCLKSQIC